MNRRRGLVAVMFVAGIVTSAGCPDNPYEAETWIEKLDDPREAETAITKIEQLGDPKAIPALAKAWDKQGRPTRILQVIIELAKPLDEKEAQAQFTKARPANWPLALPTLVKAIDDVDEANPRLVDQATKAASALGEAKLKDGLQPLIKLATKPATSKGGAVVQLTAIQALGGFTGDGKDDAAQALINILREEPVPTPTGSGDEKRAQQEAYIRQHQTFAAAMIGLAGLRTQQSVPVLIETMYRMPALFSQVRRALVASGGSVGPEMQRILAGQNDKVNALLKERKLDKYCGERNELSGDQCKPTSLRDHFAAIILGDNYDKAATETLLSALERPALPVSYSGGVPSPNTQHNGIYDALRKMGDPKAAGKVKSAWNSDKESNNERLLAVGAYAFVSNDSSALSDLSKLIEDPKTDGTLRQEALTTYARLADSAKDLDLLQRLAGVNYGKYVEAKKKSEGKEKAAYDKAKAELEKAKKANGLAKAAFTKAGGEKKASADVIKAVTETQKAVDSADEKYDEARAEWKPLDNERQAYLDFTRGLEMHVARVEIALSCKADPACYGKSLTAKPDEIGARVSKYIKTFKDWTPDEKKSLVPVQIERAMLELGKMGSKAEGQTPALLDAAKSNDRLTRQSILLALPKIAKLPCAACESKLDEAIKAGEGATTLGELNVETQMLRNYFSWAGKK